MLGFTGARAVLGLGAGPEGGGVRGRKGQAGPPHVPLGQSGLHPTLLPQLPLLSVPQCWGFKSISQVTHTHTFNNKAPQCRKRRALLANNQAWNHCTVLPPWWVNLYLVFLFVRVCVRACVLRLSVFAGFPPGHVQFYLCLSWEAEAAFCFHSSTARLEHTPHAVHPKHNIRGLS